MDAGEAIPVIDLFAGPGGLAEGMSSLVNEDGKRIFDLRLSIEKDPFARKTLLLRAFTRQFPVGDLPPAYYKYLRSENEVERIERREVLKETHPEEYAAADAEAWQKELGKPSRAEVSERIGRVLGKSRPWVLIGGPPCQAYSLAGRSRMLPAQGEKKFRRDARHTLYHEYLYILARHKPDVFIMENVKGVLSSKLEDDFAFHLIRRDLAQPARALGMTDDHVEYKLFPLFNSDPQCRFDDDLPGMDFVLKCEEFGIPQARHRVVVLGIRKGSLPLEGFIPAQLVKVGSRLTVHDAIGDLPKLRSGLSQEEDSLDAWLDALAEIRFAPWLFGIANEPLRERLLKIAEREGSGFDRGSEFIKDVEPASATSTLADPKLRGVCNHAARGHIKKDIHRYVFASAFAAVMKRSPKMSDFPRDLLPNHKNVEDAVDGKVFSDRFRVQLRGSPSATITSHIAKDGHYFIHYDPWQARSLTVREAARIQTFPDNYFFEGPRTEQYKQVGNAVPPFLAQQIAAVVHRTLIRLESMRGQDDSGPAKLEHGQDRRTRHAS